MQTLNLVRTMKFKHQAKRAALKKAVKDVQNVQAQINSTVEKATLEMNNELKKEQDNLKRIKEKSEAQKADLEAQLVAATEKATQLEQKATQQEQEIADLKASNEQLQGKVTQLEEESSLLQCSVGGTLIKYRAKLRDAAKLQYPDSDFTFMNNIYPEEDDSAE